MSYSLGANTIADIAEIGAMTQEERDKATAQYLKDHPEARTSSTEKISSFLIFGIVGTVAILFGPVVIKLLKKK